MPEHTEIDPWARRLVAHATIDTDLRYAARGIWTPDNTDPDRFQCGKSAAGLELAAVLPMPQRPQDGPRLMVSIDYPSLRFSRALRRTLGYSVTGDQLIFIVLDPQEADHSERPGVECIVANSHDGAITLDEDISYEAFLGLMDRGGICEKVSVGQRMGRWAIRQLEDLAKGYPEFGPYGDVTRW